MSALDDVVRSFMQPPHPPDPYPLYAELRKAAPIFRADDGFWYASSYAAAEAVFRSPALGQGRGRESRIRSDPRYADSLALQTLGHMLPFMDPPDHTRLRQLIARACFPNARLVVDPPPVRDDIRPSFRRYAELDVDFGV